MSTNDTLAYFAIALMFVLMLIGFIIGNYKRWAKYVWSQYVSFAVWFSSILLRHNGYTYEKGVLRHTKTFKEMSRTISSQRSEINLLHTGVIKQEKQTNQITFADIAPQASRKDKPRVPWNVYNPETNTIELYMLEFNSYWDWLKFKSDGEYIWIERKMEKTGKRDDWYKFMWVNWDEFNSKTDRDILVNFPFKLKEYDELPFKIIDLEQESKQLSLL